MSTVVVATSLFTGLVVLLSLVVLAAKALLTASHAVDIVVNHNPPLQGKTGRKLLEQLNDAGIAIPSACAGAGTCGLCKVTVQSGGGSALPTERARLTQAEIDKGVRLACQLTVREALDLTVPEDILNAQNWQCTVISTRNLSPLIKEIVLALPDKQPFEFTPGAYIQVTAPAFTVTLDDITIDDPFRDAWQQLSLSGMTVSSDRPVTRAYSVASRPQDNGKIVLLIRLALPPPGELQNLPPGKVSSYLFGLATGDTLDISGPFGEFGVMPAERDIVLIGGGVGMAPLRAIAHRQLASQANGTASGDTTRPIHFYYGARSQDDLFYDKEMEALATQHPQFDWTVALSDPAHSDNWQGPTGFIHEVVREQYFDDARQPRDSDYYLCGPPLMLQAVVAMLHQAGVDDAQIFADDFGS